MKKTTYLHIIIITLILLFDISQAKSQTLSNKLAVSISIDNYDSASVQFSWSNFSIQNTEISRKPINSVNWTVLASNVTATTFVDSSISSGVEYEYQFKVATGSTPSLAYGYIAFGVNVSAKLNRGRILLLVDDRFSSSLSSQLTTLQQDLISDGWEPKLHFCSKDTTPQFVKAQIDSLNGVSTLDAIYLIGHVPVPYSGAIRPDGHGDHFGAWPTDLFYVTDSSLWTDIWYNFTNNSRPANSNYYGDKVYDNGILPSVISCGISRIDFYNMSLLANSELQLLQNYLDRVSDYKHASFSVEETGIIDNQIANYGEGLAVSAEMSFPSLVSTSYSDSSLDFMSSAPAKWYMASSFANDTIMYGVGSVSDINSKSYQGVFSLLSGSYIGDWNTENNYMRAILANGKMLTSCWAGRPNWYFHHMGLNNPIGLSAKQSINNGRRGLFNSTAYQNSGNSSNGIHMALMGDLSLRDHYVSPVASFSVKTNGTHNELSWEYDAASSDVKYNIYSSNDALSSFTLLSTLTSGDSIYLDYTGDSSTYYFIKVSKLDSTISGSYENNSMGVFAQAGGTTITVVPVELISLTAALSGDEVLVEWATGSELNNDGFEIERRMEGETEYVMIGFVSGVGTTSEISNYQFLDNSINWLSSKAYYRLKQVDFDGKFDYTSAVAVAKKETLEAQLYPNPTKDRSMFKIISKDRAEYFNFKVTDVFGTDVTHMVGVQKINGSYRLDVSAIRVGAYYVEASANKDRVVRKLIVSR